MPNDPLQNLALLIDAAVKVHGVGVVSSFLNEETIEALAEHFCPDQIIDGG